MFFKDVIGQQAIKKRLIQSVKEERVSHAQLLAGPEGTGKLALALAYAQYVCCLDRQKNDSCGVCPSCRKYLKLAHPDLHFVFPVFKHKNITHPVSDNFIHQWREFVIKNSYFSLNQWLSFAGVENAQGMIYEKESESIIRKLNLKTFESEFKVMVIWLPEKMNIACSNKLLKIIEEPPSKTLFLLVSENEENIITTIRSRAQLIKVPHIDSPAMKEKLSELEGIDGQMVEEVVHLSNGNYIKALEFLNPDEEKDFYFSKFQELMRCAYKPDITGLIDWADELATIGREKQKGFFNYSLNLVREYFMLNLNNPSLVYLKESEKNWGKKFSPFVNERNIDVLNSEFDLAFKHISMNGNPRIIFLDMALKMAKMIRK